ncbi:glycosyltransferase family A protein [Oceaniglobus roseus]|uniref:glycosyltransferase family A protein n=1 Tax=Oceaniglobus roseus TaxID=1737570 RepID=UPI000C7EC4E8|nr:glycosyltransferase family A protein [Kandeliimicrobium roseum]
MTSFDVAIPNYNYGRYLRACVESVASQDVEALRILIIDNASTDDSAEIARDLAAADPRIELRLHARNRGPHASFNEAVDWARSDCFLILCTDDLLSPGALRRAGEVLAQDPGLAFCYGRDVGFLRDEPVPRVDSGPEAPRWHRMSGRAFIEGFCRLGVFQIPGPTLVTRTSAHKAAGHYREELPHSDDYELWLRLALVGDVAVLDNVQGLIGNHEDNRSGSLRARQLLHIRQTEAAADSFFARDAATLKGLGRLRRLARRGFAARAYWAALGAWSRGDPGARDLIRYSFGKAPEMALLPPIDYMMRRPDARARLTEGLRARLARRGSAAG